MPQVDRVFIAIVGLLQLIAGITWAVWMVFSGEGLTRFLGLIPAAILFVGAVGSGLAAWRIAKNRRLAAELAAELQRIRTINRLDTRRETIEERLESFGMLREWGIITEEEFLDKRRALLDLGEPPPAEVGSGQSGPTP